MSCAATWGWLTSDAVTRSFSWKRATIVAERDGLVCRGRDNQARHDGSSAATPTAQPYPVRLRFALRFDTR